MNQDNQNSFLSRNLVNIPSSQKAKVRNSFTLVEIMVVVAVIGVIAGIVLAAAGGVQRKAARDQAKAEIKMMTVALERYRTDRGEYPGSSGTFSITALFTNLTNYMSFKTNQTTNNQILDPYGNAYRYRRPAQATTSMLEDSYEIWSNGPDRKSDYDNGRPPGKDSADDITSWN